MTSACQRARPRSEANRLGHHARRGRRNTTRWSPAARQRQRPSAPESDASIDTTDAGGSDGAEIRFTASAPVDSQFAENNDLTLTAGAAGAVSFNANLGEAGALGQLIVTDAAGVAFGNDADPLDADLGPVALVRVEGDLDPANPDAFDVNLGSLNPIGAGGITFNAGDGNTISLVTTSDAVRLNGAVVLESDVLIDTTDAGAEAGAEIRFTVNSPIDSQPGENNDLTLTAGADGTVSFNADLGANAALGQLTVMMRPAWPSATLPAMRTRTSVP